MTETASALWTAFLGSRRIATGAPVEVALHAKEAADRDNCETLLIFNDETSALVEIDLRGTVSEVAARLKKSIGSTGTEEADATQRGPGRPKLGVVGREVTLLPRHWDWLDSQPGGASVTLRKLVEAGKRSSTEKDRSRVAREATYKFMLAIAGNEPGFEEAARALFSASADRQSRFEKSVKAWPRDVREHVLTLFHRTREI